MTNKSKPTQYELDLQAEKTLISLTLDLSEEELAEFLLDIGIERSEYDYIYSKYKHIIDYYNKSKIKDFKND